LVWTTIRFDPSGAPARQAAGWSNPACIILVMSLRRDRLADQHAGLAGFTPWCAAGPVLWWQTTENPAPARGQAWGVFDRRHERVEAMPTWPNVHYALGVRQMLFAYNLNTRWAAAATTPTPA